jgi:hypothetical protein
MSHIMSHIHYTYVCTYTDLSGHESSWSAYGSVFIKGTRRSTNGHWGNLDETTKIFPAKDHRENNINTAPSDIRLVHNERR